MEIIERKHPKTLLDDKKTLNICAPMVRYSKLAFRELVRIYNVDLVYTPMILSDVFKHSSLSREAEFKTNYNDDPVIVQFAASNGKDAADAAELVAKYVNGVDINCGCPQKWAIGEGIGSYLMTAPETVKDIVDQVKRRTAPIKMSNGQSFPCSIKIRIHDDVKETVELVRRAEKVGVDWITVHGRTKKQRNTEDVNMDYIKIVKEHSSVPVFANGGVTTKNEAEHLVDYTKTDGVMVAQGLLNNPALFAGYEYTPIDCIEKYVNLAIGYGTNHFIFHHHLMWMLESSMSKAEKKQFNVLYSIPAILDYLEDHYGLSFNN